METKTPRVTVYVMATFACLLCALAAVLPKAWPFLSWLFGGG